MLKSCPDPQDVQDLQFKLQCHLKVFENTDVSTFPSTYNLVSCASRYGLLFIGSNLKSFHVVQTKVLHNYSPKDKDVVNYPRRNVDLPSSPKHVCVNCDSTILAVVIEKNQCPVVIFYDIISFLSKNVKVLSEIRLSATPNVFAKEVNWNPAMPGIFTACKSDGSLGVIEIKGPQFEINELPAAAGVTSFCWSPKGKQIAVGSRDGKITQYKPDLKPVKSINAPPLESISSLICLQWVSNFQFIGVYQSASPEGAANVILVDAPKTGEIVYTNYEDVCYSGSGRMPQFYFLMQQTWNFLMVASANSTEVGVLGAEGDKWTQWIIQDSARAELPLGSNHQETFPVGFGFDISSTVPLPWGESQIPPCPMLLVLSHQGVLCCFNVVYLKQGVHTVCTPPDSVADISGLPSFVQGEIKNVTGPSSASLVTTPIKPIELSQNPVFGGAMASGQPSLFGSSQPLAKPLFGTQSAQTQKPGSSLFGGQTTITPTKPVGTPESSLFGGQATLTPIAKATSATPVPKTEEKYTKILSALQTTAGSSHPSQPPVVIKTEAKLPKKDETQAVETPVKKPSEPEDPKIKAETNAAFSQMIQDECTYLESEMKAILHQTKLLNINIGTDQEQTHLVTELNSLDSFLKEVVDITSGQQSEIHCLKQNLIQAWALYEEASSHYNASKDETLNLLLKAQPLDSLAEKRLNDIKQMIYYVDSQLSQTNKALDSQWDSFQDYAKKIHKVKMPTMETIFQTMVRQNAVLQKQSYVLKDLSMRLKKKNSAGNLSLLRLNEKHKNIADDLSRLHLNSQDILQLQYDKVLNQLNSLSESKTQKLRSLLKQRPVAHVTAIKPNLSSWTINQSPSKTKQMISLLGAHMSPVSKPPVARTLDFVQSTPNKAETKSQPAAGSTPLALKKDDKTFTVNQNAFVGLGSKPGSAFVPTSTQKPVGFFAISSSAQSTASLFRSTSSTPTVSSATTFTFSSAQKPNFTVQQPTATKTPETLSFGAINVPKSQAQVIVVDPFKKTETAAAPGNVTFSFGANKTPATSQSLFGGTSSLFGAVSSAPSATKQLQSSAISSSATSKPEILKSTAAISQSSAISTTKPATTTVSKDSKPIQSENNLFTATNLVLAGKVADSKPTLFSTTKSTSASSTFSFGTKTSSISSGTPTATSSASSLGASKDGTKAQSLFGATAVSTAQGSLFGSSTTSAASVASKPSAPTTTTASTFGGSTTTPSTEASKSLFGVPTASTSSSNIFAAPPSTKSGSIFGGAPRSTSGSIFGATGKIPTASESTSPSATPAASSGGVDLTGSATSASTNIFETKAVSSSTAATTQSSIFGSSTTSSVFGSSASTPSANIFGTPSSPTPSGSIFGSSTAPTTSSSGSIFGASSAGNTTTSLFGSSTAKTTATTTSIFGSSSPTTTTAASSIFGSSTAATTTSSSSVFGSSSATTTSSSIFGSSNATTTAASSSIFGSSSPSTTASSIFGGQSTTVSSAPSVFGAASNIFSSAVQASTTVAASTTSSIFGGGSATATASSVFGTPTTATTNIFGSAPSTGTSSIFGGGQSNSVFGSTQAQKPTASVFGQPASFGSTFGSGFSTAATTTQSIFGGDTTTSQSVFGGATTTQSVFGAAPASAGGSTSIFGTPAATSASVFGGGASTGGTFGSGFGTAPAASTSGAFGSPTPATQPSTPASFGFGSLSVGAGGTASGGSIFGGGSSSFSQQSPAAAANPFGKSMFSGTSTSTNLFGAPGPSAVSNSSSIFGTPTATSASAFGGQSSTGFGSPSTFGSPGFGQKPAFGQSAFGGNASFGSSTGAFSGGTASPVAQSGFGSPAFQKPAAGFGSPPVFGGSPTPAFGGAPAFGSAPVFGSPDKVFGQTSQQSGGTFGAAASQPNTGFGNLASQNTVGFGSLAQQANTQQSMPFSGSGGTSSFSSWR